MNRYGKQSNIALPRANLFSCFLKEPEDEALSSVERASFERAAHHFADAQGYSVDWDSVARLDDVSLSNGVSQIAPFDAAAEREAYSAVAANIGTCGETVYEHIKKVLIEKGSH